MPTNRSFFLANPSSHCGFRVLPDLSSISASEREMQRLNEDTATRIHSFTLVSLAMCVGVAGLQLRQLKTFFQKQHIL